MGSACYCIIPVNGNDVIVQTKKAIKSWIKTYICFQKTRVQFFLSSPPTHLVPIPVFLPYNKGTKNTVEDKANKLCHQMYLILLRSMGSGSTKILSIYSSGHNKSYIEDWAFFLFYLYNSY